VGSGIVKYRGDEITLSVLAERIGVTEAEAMKIAEIETEVPQVIASTQYI